MKVRSRRLAAGAIALGVGLAGFATAAEAVPSPERKDVFTVGCPDGEGGFVDVSVIPIGAIAFELDEDGEPTGEKFFLRSIDVAVFSDAGALLFEFHKTWGNRAGHGEPFSCSGSVVEEPGTITFFDVLVTNP